MLREAVDNAAGGLEGHETYRYDGRGRLASLASAERGGWSFGRDREGRMVSQTSTSAAVARKGCAYASQWMWGRDYCWPRHSRVYYEKQWRAVYWLKTVNRFPVVGIYYDYCTKSPDKPDGYDFRAGCAMHDYGRALTHSRNGQLRGKKSAVDAVFYTTLKDKTCARYKRHKGTICRKYAWSYYKAVRKLG
ncbi:phospholipase A2 [Actinomadura fulvescens]|uniref:Uncharacterized protein n=1 Tax=Actinomadura fulvescens TaxID=46160 RepID=A0ABN3Q4K2_9ACTN